MQLIERLLKEWSHLPQRQLPDGTRLVAHVPHVGPEAYLHTSFAPLMEEDTRKLRVELLLPESYLRFLRQFNGFSFFQGSLSLFGVRRNFSRKGDDARQPFDLVENNTLHRPPWLPNDRVVIGADGIVGDVLVISREGKVSKRSRADGATHGEWTSLESFLASEIPIIEKFWDHTGRFRPGS